MKYSWLDIFKFFKTGLMVLALVMSLAACSTDKGDVSGMETDGQEEELEEEQRACWQASLLDMFYDAMSESSMKAYPAVTKSSMPFIMVAFAIWLSLRLLKHMSSVVEEAPAEVWTEITRMAFMCVLCGLLASSTTFLLFALNKFILPIYYAFLEFGSRIIALAADGEDVNGKGQLLGDTCLFYTNSLICAAPALEPASYSGGVASFPQGPSDLMQCLVCATSDRLQLGFLISKEMLSATSLTSWVSGAAIFCIFIFVKVAFVFYLVDSIFRMNIVVIILPFLILGVPFKFSRKWAKSGVLTIFTSAAIMMCLCIIATMAMLAMQTIIKDNYEILGDKQAYQEFGVVMLSMLLIAFLVLKSINMAASLAEHIVGSPVSTDFQKKVGKLAAWVGKKAFSLITAGFGSVFTKIIDSNKTMSKIRDTKHSVSNALDHLAGRDQE